MSGKRYKKNCERCGKEFSCGSMNALWCPVCKKEHTRELGRSYRKTLYEKPRKQEAKKPAIGLEEFVKMVSASGMTYGQLELKRYMESGG